MKDPAGRTLKLAYNAEGLVETATDPMNHVIKYAYEAGNHASVTQPAEVGLRWQLKYDSSHQLTELTDGRSCKTTMEYGTGHQLLSETDPMKRTTPLICPALRGEVAGPFVRTGTYSHGILGEATAPVELFRCNRHRTYLKTFGEPRNAVLAGGVFTWDDGQRPAENFVAPREPRRVVLSSYRLGTHQRRDFPLPRLRLTLAGTPEVLRGVFGYSTHTSYAVFWVATETLSSGMEPFSPVLSAIYTARL